MVETDQFLTEELASNRLRDKLANSSQKPSKILKDESTVPKVRATRRQSSIEKFGFIYSSILDKENQSRFGSTDKIKEVPNFKTSDHLSSEMFEE